MLKFRLRSLFLLILLVALALVLVPVGQQVFKWKQGVDQLDQFAKTNFLKYGYEDVNAAAQPMFDRTIVKLRDLSPFANDEEKLLILRDCVLDLNSIQYDNKMRNSIETVERECYCDVLLQLSDFVSVDFDSELESLRDW